MGSTGASTPAPGPEVDSEKRKEIFKQSYAEVLAALKHQDDKLGRALAAQAFLTAAGITIYTQLGKDSTLTFADQALTAPLFFFLAFLVSIALALGFTLSAIGPSTPYKKKEPRVTRSLIFYAAIRNDDKWDSYLKDKTPAELSEMLAANFHAEAKDLARRVNYKVRRAREAAAFLYLGLTSLAVLGVFSQPRISESTRWAIASGVLVLSALLPLWDYFHMARLHFPEDDPDQRSYVLLGCAVALGLVLLAIAPSYEAEWAALSYALALVLTSRWGLLSWAFARNLLGGTLAIGLAILAVVIFRL
ncbi:MAG TPA: hypothetical protein VG318_16360 [Actinomycetota bacterium]|nr:hypothetical protein [Actinomycetota bacterium]